MITQEIVKNPVLEEATEERRRRSIARGVAAASRAGAGADPADAQLMEAGLGEAVARRRRCRGGPQRRFSTRKPVSATDPPVEVAESPAATDPFDEIDFGSFFDDYLDPGYKSPASESVEKPSFETFLSAPVTLADHLHSQLSVSVSLEERAGCGRIHHRQPGRGRLPIGLARGDRLAGRAHAGGCRRGAEGGAVARPGRGGRAQSARVPAAADREPERQGRRGLADRATPPAAARDAPVPGAGQGAGPAAGARRDRRGHDPASQSAAGPALFRGRRARGGAGRLLHQGRRRLHHPDERRRRAAAPAERAVPPDARPRERRHQGSARLRARALHLRHPAHEEHRAAEADHSEGLPGHRAAPDATSSTTASTI